MGIWDVNGSGGGRKAADQTKAESRNQRAGANRQ